MGRRGAIVAVASLLTLVACSAPQGPDGERSLTSDLTLSATSVPAPLDPVAAGVVAADADLSAGVGSAIAPALADFPDAAASVSGCSELVAANRQVIGLECPDAGVRYTDVSSGASWLAADLVTADGMGELVRAVAQALTSAADGDATADAAAPDQAAPGAEATDPATADATAAAASATGAADPGPAVENLNDLRFDAAGDLLVVTPNGAWSLPRAEADPILTETGRSVRGAIRSGAAFAGVVAAVAAAPSIPVIAAVPPPAQPEPPPQPDQGVDCSVLKCIALTFDDGPGADTPRLLDTLAAKGVHATFFMVGKEASAHPDTVAAIANAGHELGNHTWNHPDLTTKDEATIRSEIERTSDAITSAAGRGPIALRPPYGAKNDLVVQIAREEGLAIVNWNVDSEDWKSKDAQKTHDQVLATAKPGGIVLMHDIHSWTVDAVPSIIDDLRAQGYTLVTLTELRGGPLTPGQVIYSRGQ